MPGKRDRASDTKLHSRPPAAIARTERCPALDRRPSSRPKPRPRRITAAEARARSDARASNRTPWEGIRPARSPVARIMRRRRDSIRASISTPRASPRSAPITNGAIAARRSGALPPSSAQLADAQACDLDLRALAQRDAEGTLAGDVPAHVFLVGLDVARREVDRELAGDEGHERRVGLVRP